MVQRLILLVTLFLPKELKLLLDHMQLFRSSVCLAYISLLYQNLLLQYCTLVFFICDISLPLSLKASTCVGTAILRPSVRPSVRPCVRPKHYFRVLTDLYLQSSVIIQHYSSFAYVLHSLENFTYCSLLYIYTSFHKISMLTIKM